MNQNFPQANLEDQFLHGAKWVRADFHLHTIKESHSSRKKLRNEWRNDDGSLRQKEFTEAFVGRLKDEDIRVACITNHDTLDYGEYKAISIKSKSEGILVLPGMEVNVQCGQDGVHTLVIFDPDTLNKADTRIKDFIGGQFPGNKKENAVTSDDLPTCFEKLEKLDIDYFVVFAHVNSDNGLLNSVKGGNLQQLYQSSKPIWKKRVLGFQKVRRERHVIEQKLGDIPVPAFVEGSDPCDSIEQVGSKDRGLCYLKLSDLSFGAVKFALRDYHLRVRNSLPEERLRAHIISLEIETQRHGVFRQFFSKDLNCLIGSRGSGKSFLIEALRWVLGKESGSGDDHYKQELLHAFLQKGGKVILHGVSQNGDQINVTRHYLGKRDQPPPEVRVNQQIAQISPDTIFSGLLYFGQKDLGIRSEQSDSQLFEQLLGSLPLNFREDVEQKSKHFQISIQRYSSALNAKETDDEYAYELTALNAKLSKFRELGIEEKLKEITQFDDDLRSFREFHQSFLSERAKTNEQLDSLSSLSEKVPTLKSPKNTKASRMLENAQKFLNLLNDTSNTIDENLERLADNFELAKKILELNEEKLQSRFGEILREIDEPSLDLDSYRTMVSRQTQLAELRELSKQRSEALPVTKRELIAAGEQWITARKAAAEHQNAQLKALSASLPEKLNLEIEAFGDRDKFDQLIDERMSGTNFTTQARESLSKTCSSGFEIFKRWDSLKQSELTPAMASKLEDAMSEDLEGFLFLVAPNARHISFDGKRINELSLGKRAMALLVLLLSLEDYPMIIIDQPEDDLDNETIHRMIVEPLRNHKGKTQFIIATHNPNIPVLADSEQVIDCHETEKGQYEQNHGSLDKPSTKDAIIKIMEGGEAAFERRHEIYSQWTK